MVALLLLFLLALAVAAPALGASHNVSISAYSPLLSYTPGKNGDLARGEWNATTTAGWQAGTQQVFQLSGDKYMRAVGEGAGGADAPRVSYSFSGTGVAFVGFWGTSADAAPGSVGLVVDGEETVFESPAGAAGMATLAAATFAEGTHEVALVVRSGTIELDSVRVTLDFPGIDQGALDAAAAEPNITTALEPHGTYYARAAALQDSGQWAAKWVDYPGMVYPRLVTKADGAWVYTALPAGSALLQINGTTDSMAYQYTVEVDPAPPGRERKETLAHYSTWTKLDVPLYLARLDPEVTYSVRVSNRVDPRGTAQQYLNIVAFETWGVGASAATNSTSGGTNGTATNQTGITGSGADKAAPAAHSTNNTPIIVGCVVGGLVLIALITLVILYRKRLLCHRNKETDEVELDYGHVEAYHAPSSFVTSAITPLGSEPKYPSSVVLRKDLQHDREVEIITVAQDGGAARVRERVVPPLYDPAWRTTSTSLDSIGHEYESTWSARESSRDAREAMDPAGRDDPHIRKW